MKAQKDAEFVDEKIEEEEDKQQNDEKEITFEVRDKKEE